MKQWFQKGLALLLTLAAAAAMTLPRTLPAQAYGTGDIVEFGSYPQSRVTDAGLITALNACTLGADNTVAYEGLRYQRVYFTSPINTAQAENGYVHHTVYWFRFDPIRWKVLAGSDTDLLLLAESILDDRVYNTPSAAVTWGTCTLRAWLGDGFLNKAFSPGEQAKILSSSLVNADNPAYGTEGGADTNDRVFLLSYADSINTAYGFNASDTAGDAARKGTGSDYAKCQGLKVFTGFSIWWLRSPGQSATYAQACNHLGWSSNSFETTNQNYIGVRPSIHVNLTVVTYETGDIIEYGSYPQSELTDQSIIAALNTLTPDLNNNVLFEGTLYKRVFFTTYTANYTTAPPTADYSYQDDNGYYINMVYWFKYESVRWRVLSNTAGELLLLSEDILTPYPYNLTYNSVTWETCGLRTWLNDTFQLTAFSDMDNLKIKTTQLVNEDNPWQGTEGGGNTQDKLFILGYDDVTNVDYGFTANDNPDTARVAKGTDYAKCRGLYVASTDESIWTLRIPGESQASVGTVGGDGSVWNGEFFTIVNFTGLGIRPAFKINTSSPLLSPVAGSGCVVDYLGSGIWGLAPGISSLSGYAQAAAGYTVQCVPKPAGFGTDSTVRVKLGDTSVELYKIVIYGDVNGDGNIDTADAGVIVDVENFLITWYPATDASFIEAGDLNGDGNIDTADAGIIIDYENFLLDIDQATGLAE